MTKKMLQKIFIPKKKIVVFTSPWLCFYYHVDAKHCTHIKLPKARFLYARLACPVNKVNFRLAPDCSVLFSCHL